MDLTTRYAGLQLEHPFIMGASPLVDDIDTVRRIEDHGAAAIVMHSLFEEQLTLEELANHEFTVPHQESTAEAMSYLPDPHEFELGPDEYLEQLRRIKEAVDIPVFASLNGVTARGWLDYAKLIEQAGADALELNLYTINGDPTRTASDFETEQLEMIRKVKTTTGLRLALKISSHYTSLSHFVRLATQAGVDAFVIFNRFYQPDLDLEELEVSHRLELSNSSELLMRIRWLAILSAQSSASFAVTGGVHVIDDAVKALMSGAHGVQMVSEILKNGTTRFREMQQALGAWLEDHHYSSLDQLRGSMNLARCPDPTAYARTNYMRVLGSWRGLNYR